MRVTAADGTLLTEGKDFEPLRDPTTGNVQYPGTYDLWHAPPVLKTKFPDGTRLLASYFHAVTTLADQSMLCPSEPKTVEILKKTAREIHRVWGANRYFMGHDEIRFLNHCDACRKRNLSAGQILADNVRSCIGILREVNPGGKISVWSDMFDPNHNAHANYYLVRGDLASFWEGLDKDVVMVPWAIELRERSLPFFAKRGHRQLIAGYYDEDPAHIHDWLDAAKPYSGVSGVMYTSWRNDYANIERFAREAGFGN